MLGYLNILNALSRGEDPQPGEASTSQVESSQKKAARPRKRKAPVAANADDADADEEATGDLWDDGSAQSLLPDDVAKIPGMYTFIMFSLFDDTAMPVLCVSFEFAG